MSKHQVENDIPVFPYFWRYLTQEKKIAQIFLKILGFERCSFFVIFTNRLMLKI